MGMSKGFFVALAGFFLLLLSAVPQSSQAACPAPALIVGQTYSYSPVSIQDAYDYASTTLGLTDFTLRLAGELFQEDLYFDGGSVILDGGYDRSIDCSFTTKSGTATAIFGTVIVSAGAVSFAGDIGIVSTDRCDFDTDLDGFTRIGSCLGSADDCNDRNANVYPGAVEICDGLDNNCNGLVDEGLLPDADGDGYYGSACGQVGEDCNDSDAGIHPGALDTPYDGIDQDCSGADLTFTGEACSECHLNPPGWAGLHDLTTVPDPSCAGCHAPIVSNILPGHYGRTVMTDGNGMTAGSTIVCVSCHDANSGHTFFQLGNSSNLVWGKVVSDRPNITCDTCHENRALQHETAAAHNQRIILAECGNCHTSDTANIGPSATGTLVSAADVDTLHRSDCALCHNYTGSKLNTTTVRQVIAQGVAGTPVSCTACHVDKASNHIDFVHPIAVGPNDLSYSAPGMLCSWCHRASTWAEIEGVVHNVITNGSGSCATCHNSTRPEVIATIALGANPTRCLDCHADKELTEHGMVDHAALGYVTAGGAYCVTCHTGPDPLVDTHKFNCLLCHSTVPALQDGLPTYAGTDITCLGCHTNSWDGIHSANPPSHNSLVRIDATTSCGNCHSDPPPLVDAVNPKVHNSCFSCHDATGGLISKALDKDFVTGGNCTTCHTGSWETIHPNAPQSHSSCTSCHDATTGALLILNR